MQRSLLANPAGLLQVSPPLPHAEAASATPLRILEIGDQHLFLLAAPEQTDFYWTGVKPRGQAGIAFGPVAFARSLWRLWRGHYDLVVLHVPDYGPFHPRVTLTILRDWHARAYRGWFAVHAWRLIQYLHRVPMVAVDLNDSFGIARHAFPLIDACRVYFKRELPADRWLVFFRTGHPNLPGRRWRSRPRNARRLAKLAPLSYGAINQPSSGIALPKTTDIFFAGSVVPNSTARADGLRELLALRDEGYRVDIPEGRIEPDEFERRLASAFLAWSPGGYGWECGRHYEAAAVGTVPVMNYPTIQRDVPLRHGEHCIFYPVEPGGLANALRAALADRPALDRMGAAAREHYWTHHTPRARAERIAGIALGRSLDGRSVAPP